MMESIAAWGCAEGENCSFYYYSDYETESAALLTGCCTVQTSMLVFVPQDNREDISSQSISTVRQRNISHRSKEQNKSSKLTEQVENYRWRSMEIIYIGT